MHFIVKMCIKLKIYYIFPLNDLNIKYIFFNIIHKT